MADKIHEPKTALSKLLYDYGYSVNFLVKRGYFSNPSTAYTIGYRDVKSFKVDTIASVSEVLDLSPGTTLDILLEIQNDYPPKKPMKK